MNLSENCISAFKSITQNKLRALLTLIGVVIGIFSITSVMSVLGIMQRTVEKNLNVMGTNTFYIHIFPAVDLTGDLELKYANRRRIVYADYFKLKSQVTSAGYISASATHYAALSFGKKITKSEVEIVGATKDWLFGAGYTLQTGRMITNDDIRKNRNIAVMGHEVKKVLMPYISPEGRALNLNGRQLRIVGTLEKKGAVFGESQDNLLVIPLTLFQKLFGRPEEGLDISVTVKERAAYQDCLDETTAVLRQIRKIPLGEPDDFEITSNKSLVEKFNSITRNIKIAAIASGVVALMAAGIGIMNIMLVTVTERTKEVGIRKSLGATRMDILSQFLLEAVLLTETGGIIGVILAMIITETIAVYMKMEILIPWNWIFIGIGVCTAAGITFGVYPAMKAANLDPVKALNA